jgi:hypothetical protein
MWVVGPPAAAVTVVLGAGLGSGHRSMRGRTVSDVGTSSRPKFAPAPSGRKLYKPRAAGGEGPPVSANAAAAALPWVKIGVRCPATTGSSRPTALGHKLETRLFCQCSVLSWMASLFICNHHILGCYKPASFKGGPYDRQNRASMQCLPAED